jgi:hypothetical protein
MNHVAAADAQSPPPTLNQKIASGVIEISAAMPVSVLARSPVRGRVVPQRVVLKRAFWLQLPLSL